MLMHSTILSIPMIEDTEHSRKSLIRWEWISPSGFGIILLILYCSLTKSSLLKPRIRIISWLQFVIIPSYWSCSPLHEQVIIHESEFSPYFCFSLFRNYLLAAALFATCSTLSRCYRPS